VATSLRTSSSSPWGSARSTSASRPRPGTDISASLTGRAKCYVPDSLTRPPLGTEAITPFSSYCVLGPSLSMIFQRYCFADTEKVIKHYSAEYNAVTIQKVSQAPADERTLCGHVHDANQSLISIYLLVYILTIS
jgi:hypothetical protein